MAAGLRVRPAEPRDAAAVAEIYNQGIEDRIATFEIEPRTPEAVERQLVARADRYPAVVVEDGDGVVLGFAWTAEYRPREAYAGVAEVSIYVARGARGRGSVGWPSALLSARPSGADSGSLFPASSRRMWRAGGSVPR